MEDNTAAFMKEVSVEVDKALAAIKEASNKQVYTVIHTIPIKYADEVIKKLESWRYFVDPIKDLAPELEDSQLSEKSFKITWR